MVDYHSGTSRKSIKIEPSRFTSGGCRFCTTQQRICSFFVKVCGVCNTRHHRWQWPASDSQQAARATPKGLAPPAGVPARKRADFLAVRSKNAIAARNMACFLADDKKNDALSIHIRRPLLLYTLAKKSLFFRQCVRKIQQMNRKTAHLGKELQDFLSKCAECLLVHFQQFLSICCLVVVRNVPGNSECSRM